MKYDAERMPAPRTQPADPNDWGARRFDVEGRALTFGELQQLPTAPAALKTFLLEPYANVAWKTPADLTYRLFTQVSELSAAPVWPW